MERPTKKELFRYLGKDKSYERSFFRDLDQLREEFGITIKPESNYRYEVVTDTRDYKENLLTLLNGLRIKSLLSGFQGDSVEFGEMVVVSNPGGVGGQWLEGLFEAISQNKEIRITHKSYRRDHIKEYDLQPYQLREHDQRWYLIAWSKKDNAFRNFGLDRIETIDLTGEVFKPTRKDEVLQMFRHKIGMWESSENPVDIVVWFDDYAMNYIKSAPWHHSQEVISEDKKGITVKWHLVPNYELLRLMMSWPGQFKVLKPESLRNEIKELSQKSLELNN